MTAVYTWTQLGTSTEPNLDASHALVADKTRGVMVACGGGNSAPGKEIWTLDLNNPSAGWVDTGKAYTDSAASRAACWDVSNNNVVIFGGGGNLGFSSVIQDTYVWDGTNLTLKTPTHKPSTRTKASMIYSHALNSVIMHGGMDNSGSPIVSYTDTWKWDGSDWTQLVTTHVPDWINSPLCEIGTNIYGIATNGSVMSTWKFDGTDWSQVATTTNPIWRDSCAMAPFPPRNTIIMTYGNQGGTGVTPTLYEFNGTDWAIVTATNTGPVAGAENRFGTAGIDPSGTKIIFKDFYPAAGSTLQTWTLSIPVVINARLTQEAVESLDTHAGNARLTQEATETLETHAGNIRLTQESLETLETHAGKVRLTQGGVEVLYNLHELQHYLTQLAVETLVSNTSSVRKARAWSVLF